MKDVYRKTVSRTVGLAAMAAVFFLFATPVQSQNCQFYIDLYDSFGDGWNGCTITVKVNNVNVLTNVTLASGSGPGRFSFLANVNDVITTHFTPSSWPEECSYRILDGKDNILVTSGPQSGGPPNRTYTVVSSACFAPPVLPSGCDYTIRMWDEYGDGWNGCYLKIHLNGVLMYNNITFSSGTGPVDYKFTVDNGDSIRVTFVQGSWPEECYFRIYNKWGQQIYVDGLNYSIPKANYTFIGIAACSYDFAVQKVVLGYADKFWARRAAPDGNKVHVTLEDIDGTQPTRVKAVYKIGSMPADSTDGVAESFDLTWSGPLTDITFQQRITTLSTGLSPVVYVKIFHPDDSDASNNSGTAMQQEVFDDKVQGFEDFIDWEEPLLGPSLTNTMGWTTADLDGGNFWQSVNWPPMAVGHPGGTNDWIFMPAAYLEEAASYRVQGEFLAAFGGASMDIAFGPAPDPSQMTVFASLTNASVLGTWSFADAFGGYAPYFNTPPVAGDYYIGLRLRSGMIVIDWLKLDENPSPPPKIGYGAPGAKITEFVDVEGASINLTAIYKQPGKIVKTYEVASTTDIYGLNGDFLWDVETTDSWISITKETPDPTMQGYNFTPPRPRQFQSFTMSIDPSGLAPGLHTGVLRFYGTLFNDDFPPPDKGLTATNEIYEVKVNLRIITAGTKNGPTQLTASWPGVLTVAGSPYNLVDQSTGLPLAIVNVTNGQINSMTVRCFPNQLPTNLARKMYVMRYWQIDYTGSGWTADITFPYADQEAAMVADRAQLRGIRQDPAMGPWEDPISGTTSVSDPINNSVTVNNLNEFNIIGNIALAHPYMIAVKSRGELPSAFALEQNYPNPFNPSTTIAFDVAEERHVRLVVYNSLGAEVAVLADEVLAAGSYTRTFDATGMPSGTYVYRLTAGDFVQTQRMTLSK
ncbi:MAG: T9SS type A sorting domain-containing protein [Bacteroidetes bacterium]|nr:T9SS type A sorting domain-containing protein [Bacteroidota bacterium]